jgi:hypothetical protein
MQPGKVINQIKACVIPWEARENIWGLARKSAAGTPRPLIEFSAWVRGDAGGTHAAGPTNGSQQQSGKNVENRNPPPLIEVKIILWEPDAGTWGVSYRWGNHCTSEKIGSQREAEAYAAVLRQLQPEQAA